MSRSLIHPSPMELSYSTQPQAVTTVVSRTEATQLLLLNSKNRNQTSSTGKVANQPWNKFRVERPQALMESFATRLLVSEIRFPWYIPNITVNNNFLYIEGAGVTGNAQAFITLAPGFYTPADIVSEINSQLSSSGIVAPPVVSYSGGQYTFTGASAGATEWNISWFNPVTNPSGSGTLQQEEFAYNTSPSLCQTLGLTFYQASGEWSATSAPYILIGNITESLYTQYVDIVSEKLNYYSTTKDGSSDNATSKALVCRVYLADEVSLANNEGLGQAPFIIHRQFKTPKAIMWNKESVIDQLDISVVDQYGQLVPLPATSTSGVSSAGSYPDFQIGILASEN